MLLTVYDLFMLLTVHDPGLSVRQQINSWNILYYVNIVKGECHSYCTRYNVRVHLPSLLHPIQCAYHCTVPVALDKMCISLYRPYCTQYNVRITVSPCCTRYNVYIPLPSLLHPIQCAYHLVVRFAPDTMCVSLYRPSCTRYNVLLYSPYCTRYNTCTSVPSLLHLMQCVYHHVEYEVSSPFVLHRNEFIFH
jgi:hypothetical protein